MKDRKGTFLTIAAQHQDTRHPRDILFMLGAAADMLERERQNLRSILGNIMMQSNPDQVDPRSGLEVINTLATDGVHRTIDTDKMKGSIH
tara:strand:- start:27861 stop:28130 length:270 start_codon:yes stop_codon:yes gene_type:complete